MCVFASAGRSWTGQELEQVGQWACGDGFREWDSMRARIDDIQMVQGQIGKCGVHGLGGGGSLRVFEFEAEPLAAEEHQQVEFRAGVGGPEVGVVSPVTARICSSGRETSSKFER